MTNLRVRESPLTVAPYCSEQVRLMSSHLVGVAHRQARVKARSTHSPLIVRALNGTPGGAVLGGGALVGPQVAVVAVLVPVDLVSRLGFKSHATPAPRDGANLVKPSPVCIEHDLAGFIAAATAVRACLPAHLGVRFGGLGADLLGGRGRHEGGDGSSTIHVGRITRGTTVASPRERVTGRGPVQRSVVPGDAG